MVAPYRAFAAAAKAGKQAHAQEMKQQVEKQLARRENPSQEIEVRAYTTITPENVEEEVPAIPAARLLSQMSNVYQYWARYKTQAERDVLALWAASTWFASADGRLLFNEHPRVIWLADPESGKTRGMKLTRAMSRNPTAIGKGRITAPGVREALENGMTVFIDEYDRRVGRGMRNEELQELVGAYEAETGSIDGSGGYDEHPIFGPMMIGAKPRLRTGTQGYLEDLFTRAFILTPEKYENPRDPIPELDEDFDEVVTPIPIILERWTAALRKDLYANAKVPAKAKFRPIHDIPAEFTARQRDLVKPLLAVADRAVDPDWVAEHGSDVRWAKRGRAAVRELLTGQGSTLSEILDNLDAKFKALGME